MRRVGRVMKPLRWRNGVARSLYTAKPAVSLLLAADRHQLVAVLVGGLDRVVFSVLLMPADAEIEVDAGRQDAEADHDADPRPQRRTELCPVALPRHDRHHED